MKRAFEDFTRLYPLAKTLRFELKPVGATLDNFLKSGILEQDEHRADSYQKAKKLIDEYHKVFIDRVMSGFVFPFENRGKLDSLSEYSMYYSQKGNNEESKKHFEDLQDNLRKAVAKVLTKDEAFKRIDKKELIEQDLIEFINCADEHQLQGLTKEQALALAAEFKGFTTYFVGFHQNRANMYSAEEQSTAIAYRLVNDNLPRFIDNAKVFQEVEKVPDIQQNLRQLYAAYESVLSVQSIQEMFQLEYYNKVLTQNQIDLYNSIIGGKTLENGQTKVQGLNEYINLYNQRYKQDAKRQLPKLKSLYKQILSDRLTLSWLPEEFKSDQQMLNAIQACYEQLSEYVFGEKALKYLLESLTDYNLDGIYLRNDSQINELSQKVYGSWNVIEQAVKAKIAPDRKRKESEEAYQERISTIYKRIDSFSIRYINECVRDFIPTECHTIEGYFKELGAVNTGSEQRENLFYRIANAYADVASLLRADYPKDKRLAQDKENVERIKNLLDAIKVLQRFVKPLLGKGDESGKDERFYGELSFLWNELDSITLLYNRVRNRMTKKPYSEEKIKLSFENALLLNGWDENKESDNACIILRRNDLYYLGIMNKTHKSLLNKQMPSKGECYEKMVYKLLPGANKMLPKVFFSQSRIDEFKPSGQVLANYKKGTHKKGADFRIEDCHKLIDFFKHSIEKHPDWSKFNFVFSDTSTYEDLSSFYREVEQQGYKISFKPVSVSCIDQLVNEGKMYLFQIYNKDFSKFSKGTPNLHTLYWKALFSEENLKDVVYKLGGQAEVFYRKKSLSMNRPTHPANKPVQNKNKQNCKKESLFAYDLIKDRRYTVDKFLFHVPITMNFKSHGSDKINQAVLEYLQTAEDAHVIGIDRGERHLLYLVVIDRHGTIKEQLSLNEIANTNYHDLLDTREKERQEARQSWQTIENIKELKEGYLSQVVHKIAQLMMKYHAIVVLEDLNFGFMRGRQKVEKQVYQKFEKMLIDKLNFLVDKKTEANQPGGLFHAYQLVTPFESFRKLGKQSGFLFYVPAWNTSKIDPVTGFVNLLDVSSVNKAKDLFSQFQSIRYNDEKDWFEFTFDYAFMDNNDAKEKAKGTKTQWTLCTQGERIETIRDKNNKWCSQRVNPTQLIKDLFRDNHIDIHSDLKEAISKQDDTELKKNDKKFFEELMRCLKLTLQMRNSEIGKEVDYLVSPVVDEHGRSYDSRTCGEDLPQNADANGAYNIARKGLMMVDQIRKAEDLKNLKFDLSNKGWLNFAQQKPYLHD